MSKQPIVVKAGRFGEYVTDGEYNATLRKDDTVEAITLERAAELLAERREKGPAKKAAKKTAKRAPAKKTAKKTGQEGRGQEAVALVGRGGRSASDETSQHRLRPTNSSPGFERARCDLVPRSAVACSTWPSPRRALVLMLGQRVSPTRTPWR